MINSPTTTAPSIPTSTVFQPATRVVTGRTTIDLQKALNLLGYSLVVDGSYGPATTSAVKSFQAKYGLTQDGSAGPTTWGKLEEVISKYYETLDIQRALNILGYSLTEDGSYGPATTSAVRDFQTKTGITVDGSVGPQTWTKIYAELEKLNAPKPTTPTTPEAPYFRVRITWEDSKTQKGAFHDLDGAKQRADEFASEGYKVFDESGKVVYTPTPKPVQPPIQEPAPQPPVVEQPKPQDPPPVDTSKFHGIMGTEAEFTVEQAEIYLHRINQNAPVLAHFYKEEADAESVRWDIPFAQTLKETGNFNFGGDAKPEWNNFCGLGVTGAKPIDGIITEKPFVDGVVELYNKDNKSIGVKFATPKLGIRAQIQHLKAYASSEALNKDCVDPRFRLVSRGLTPYVEWLGAADNPQGKGWAVPGAGYGASILDIVARIKAIEVPKPETPSVPAENPKPENPPVTETPAETPVEVPKPEESPVTETPAEQPDNKKQNILNIIIEFFVKLLDALFD